MGWLAVVPFWLEILVLLASAVVAFFTLRKYIYTPLKGHFNKVNAGMDTLLGYPAVKDPGTGIEIQPATPALALRVYDLERSNAQVADALQTIAETNKRTIEIQAIMDERKAQGDKVIEEWLEWRKQHEDEAAAREDRIADWEAWRSEQTLLLETIKEINGLPTHE